jgi:beta-fructofuranosidase
MRLIFISILILGFSSAIAGNGHRPIASWNFDKQDSWVVYENQSGVAYPVSSNIKAAEFVQGIRKEAIRLDGYSTFIKGKLSTPVIADFTMTGSFALETFPTDTAGFFALGDSAGENSIGILVNQYGKLLVGVTSRGKTHYASLDTSVPRFKWFQVSASIGKNSITVWLDKSSVGQVPYEGSRVTYDQIYLGRDSREKLIYRFFPVTSINGVMDEVAIWSGALDSKRVAKIVDQYNFSQKPDLAIPASRFANDFNRPQYHLLPAANWTNETHGLIHHHGKYHLFNQKNGSNVYLGQINWGHFSSSDLIHWKEHKSALIPEPLYDKYGIWSGHVIKDDSGVPMIMYTGSDGTQNSLSIAFPEDEDLVNWKKYKGNPVVKHAPTEFSRIDMRDPYMWKENDTWYMIVGYGIEKNTVQKGAVLLYKSPDLKSWTYVNPLFIGDPENDDSGVFWEMPVFWKLDGKYILLVNKVPQPGKPAVAFYWVGDFRNETFVPDNSQPKKLEVINRLLSPSVTLDQAGRTIAMAIIPDETSAAAQLKQGWTHVYSIPRTWQLNENKIQQRPHPELENLRMNPGTIKRQQIDAEQPLTLSSNRKQMEFSLSIKPGNTESITISIGKNNDNSEYTNITFDYRRQKISVDLRKSTLNPDIDGDFREVDYTLDPKEPLNIKMFLDGSVAEFFLENGDAFTTRMFPFKSSSDQVVLSCSGGSIELQAEMWTLKTSGNKTDW